MFVYLHEILYSCICLYQNIVVLFLYVIVYISTVVHTGCRPVVLFILSCVLVMPSLLSMPMSMPMPIAMPIMVAICTAIPIRVYNWLY